MTINNKYFLNPAHLEIAKARYFLKDENGNCIEDDMEDVFQRVVNYIYKDDPNKKSKDLALKYRLEKKIIDGGRILSQAGTKTKNLFNCFVIGFEDDTREAISELKRKHFNIQASGGGCVGEQTYVYTKEFGITKIKDIPLFDKVTNIGVANEISELQTISYNQNMNIFQSDKITHLWKFNVKAEDVRIINFKAGQIKTSAWHPFIVVESSKNRLETTIKRADQLCSGDLILSLRPNNNCLISNSEEEFSWLLGYLMGDGNISKTKLNHDRMRFYDSNTEILKRVKHILSKYDCAGHMSKDPRENCYIVSATCVANSAHGNANKKLRALFDKLLSFFDMTCGKKFKLEKFNDIPSLSSFMAGIIDAEGYIGVDRTSISMTDGEFIKCLRRYVALLGVKSHIRERVPKRSKDSYMYEFTYANGWNRLFPTVKESRLPKTNIYSAKSERVEGVGVGEKDEIFYDFTVKNNNNYIAYNNNAFIVIHNTGINFSTLRPSGSVCKSSQARSSGAVGYITDLSYQSANISQGGNRSGANLGLLEDWHPDLLEFISKKSNSNWENIRSFASIIDEEAFSDFQWRNPHVWQMFNVSVGLSDEFMERVIDKSEKPWILRWKDVEWHLWDFVNGKQTISVTAPDKSIATFKASAVIPYFNGKNLKLVKGPYDLTASEWYTMICKHAWKDGCPGVIFMDLAKKYHNGEYFGTISCGNPCSELLLPVNSVCNLTSLCLPSFYIDDKFDFEDFKCAIQTAVRGLDNVIDISKTGEKDIDNNICNERRIGLGTTGVAELLIMKKLKYSSEKAREFVAEILEFYRNTAYETSIELAKERGTFKKFEFEGFSKSKFFKTLPKSIKDSIQKHGIRNVTLLTQPPVGTTGTMLGFSQGCEPYFAMNYTRNSRVGTFCDGSPIFSKWLIDNNVDYSKYNYNLKELKKEIRVPDYFEEAQDVSWENHLAMQATFAKYIDSSISKTINLSNDTTIKDIENVFIKAYELGIKNTTIYRDGSKKQILEHINKKHKKIRPLTIVPSFAPPRPESLECDIHHTSILGNKWTVLVGLFNNKPYEVFSIPYDALELSEKYKTGSLVKSGSGSYCLDTGDFKIKNVTKYLKNDEHKIITRLLSTNLRHGVAISFLIDQLNKADGSIVDFSKALMRILRKYDNNEVDSNTAQKCTNCGSVKIKIGAGCFECRDCGFSKCE